MYKRAVCHDSWDDLHTLNLADRNKVSMLSHYYRHYRDLYRSAHLYRSREEPCQSDSLNIVIILPLIGQKTSRFTSSWATWTSSWINLRTNERKTPFTHNVGLSQSGCDAIALLFTWVIDHAPCSRQFYDETSLTHADWGVSISSR